MRERADVAREITADVEAWWERFNAALATGLSEAEALSFANEGELEQLAKLIEGGCPPRLIARIVA